jgi:chorismate-pyruvate lyase
VNPLDELNALVHSFSNDPPLIADAEHVPSALTPEPYKSMLVHDQHMTVTMESYHRSKVDVQILERSRDGETYCRKILLLKAGTPEVVQFGLVRFNFQYVTAEVRDEIVAGNTPLGRVLINHNVLRQIDLGAILRITMGPQLHELFGKPAERVTYGRLATIFCNKRPAVDLLEVTVPLPLRDSTL